MATNRAQGKSAAKSPVQPATPAEPTSNVAPRKGSNGAFEIIRTGRTPHVSDPN